MSDTTIIEISKQPTRKRLRIYKAKHGFTYDQAINQLLDEVTGEQEMGAESV